MMILNGVSLNIAINRLIDDESWCQFSVQKTSIKAAIISGRLNTQLSHER
jgi:hypothetical protein